MLYGEGLGFYAEGAFPVSVVVICFVTGDWVGCIYHEREGWGNKLCSIHVDNAIMGRIAEQCVLILSNLAYNATMWSYDASCNKEKTVIFMLFFICKSY